VRSKIVVAPGGNIFVRDWTRVESDEDALTFIAKHLFAGSTREAKEGT
jgi:hypothetical protein